MGFQILRTSPVHCPIRDGIIGSKTTALPNSYETLDCAFAIAGRLEQESYDGCGDDSFGVAPYGSFKRIYRTMRDLNDAGPGWWGDEMGRDGETHNDPGRERF